MDISALILAGGKSSRMKGRNKAFLEYNNKSFIENIAEALKDFDNIYISVDKKEKYKDLNYSLIEDKYKDIGPMGGIFSTFKYTNTDFLFVAACDMPKINSEFIKFMISNVKEHDSCVVAKDSKGRLYPLGAVYNKNILPIMEEMIKNKDYKLVNLIKNVNGKIVSLEDSPISEEVLINVNDPEEYKKLNDN